jgi:Tfp pilus assembly pilus retraction ATPase PilT
MEGQGKSTALAAMIDDINCRRAHHILTVQDPIEFIHPIKKGVVNQRQLDSTLRKIYSPNLHRKAVSTISATHSGLTM